MNTMIRSNYLNTDIPVQMYEAYNEREEKVLIITHASLEHFLFDQLPAYMRNLKVSMYLIPLHLSYARLKIPPEELYLIPEKATDLL